MDLVTDNLGYDVWDVEDIPSNTSSPIWVLGKRYKYEEINEIRQKIASILWVTYRKGFPPIGSPSSYQYTSDKGKEMSQYVQMEFTFDVFSGFGCMIRCGQMLMAEALKRVHLGRDWTWTRETQDETYLKIVNRFIDERSAPYSIHQISEMGQESGKKISDWFSPNEISQVLK